MKTVVLSFGFIVLLIVVGLLGLFAVQPGLTLTAICTLPLATLGLGYSLGRKHFRVSVTSAEGF